MLVAGREAIRILRPIVKGDAQAKLVLRSGLAGERTATPRGPMYDDQRVRSLMRRPIVDITVLPELCPHGLYIARVPRTAELDVNAPWPDLAAALGVRPPMPSLTSALLSVQMRAWNEGLPWVATVCGWVVLGAQARGFRPVPGVAGRTCFDLAPPEGWFRAFQGGRLPTTRGGRSWYLWTPPLA